MLLEQRIPSPCKGEGQDGGGVNRLGVYEHPHPSLPPCRGKECIISTALILRGQGISPSKVPGQLLSSHAGAL